MCGRFVSASPPEEIAEYFGATAIGDELGPNYNVAPTSDVYVVYNNGDQRRLDPFHWGLVPSFAKDLRIGNKMINARAETVAEKPAFRDAFARRRCLIIADGFYEWERRGPKARHPFHITRTDAAPFAFAGLWATWHGPGDQRLRTCSIITTAANDTVRELHDRMPVILDEAAEAAWLDPATPTALLPELLHSLEPQATALREVSRAVNDARHDEPDCLDPPPPEAEPTLF